MSDIVKRVNLYFRTANKKEVEYIRENCIFTDRQKQIFEMYYIRRQNVGYISDIINVSQIVVNVELKLIREKIIKLI